MTYIRNFIFRLFCKRQPARSIRFPHYECPLNILLLFESDYLEANKSIKFLRDQLLADKHTVSLWGYVAKKEVLSPILPQSRILGIKDFSLLGIPSAQIQQDLQKEHYDLMIDISTTPILPLQYIAALTQADCKIGLYRTQGGADIMINIPENSTPEYLFEQIVNYIQKINSND